MISCHRTVAEHEKDHRMPTPVIGQRLTLLSGYEYLWDGSDWVDAQLAVCGDCNGSGCRCP